MKKEIEIQQKKPRLAYVGMDRKTIVEAVPTQVVEVVYPSKAEKDDIDTFFAKGTLKEKINKSAELPKNRLIWTNDNLVALRTLLDEKDPITGEYKYRNKVDLIYIDPPFMIQDDFVSQNSIDIEVDEKEGVISVKEPTIIETIAYKDTWHGGMDSFLQMMRERLLLMNEILSPTGSIYVHLDWHTVHYVKVLMDEIFDYEFFEREIIWRIGWISGYKSKENNWIRNHDTILFYTKAGTKIFNKEYISYPDKYVRRDGNKPEGKGYPIEDTWNCTELDSLDSIQIKSFSNEKTGYPTQKNIDLIQRIIRASCPKGGIVLDAFMGAGTTCEAAEQLSEELNCSWIGIDNSKFATHTARKRLIELHGKSKGKKGEGVYKVRPFTVENMGYYQRGVKWDPIQVSDQADAYRKAIIELFGGEYAPYSKILHGKKRGSWIHVGPLSTPIQGEQIRSIAKEVKGTEFKKVYVLSADYTAHNQSDINKIKQDLDVQVVVRLIPASAIEEVKKRLELMKQGAKESDKINEMPNIAFFAPLTVKIHSVTDGKEVMMELSGLEVDTESFLDSQEPERRDKLKKWLEKEKSWKSFVDFWAIDWDYDNLKGPTKEPIFENEWQSFRKRKGKATVEDLVFKAFHVYEKPGTYTIAVKVTDVFGNDGIISKNVIVK